jgi:hypothetical protein
LTHGIKILPILLNGNLKDGNIAMILNFQMMGRNLSVVALVPCLKSLYSHIGNLSFKSF